MARKKVKLFVSFLVKLRLSLAQLHSANIKSPVLIVKHLSIKKRHNWGLKSHNFSFVYALYEAYFRQDIFRNSIIHADNSQGFSADC
jgi:predicted metallopeptidase